VKYSILRRTLFIASLTLVVAAFWVNTSADSATERGAKTVTFSEDVAPIIQKKCEECHRTGGVAPMAFSTYEQARPWAKSIREKAINRQMPPFHALGEVGRYAGDPRLTDSEISTIRDWVDGGAKPGDKKDMPPARVWKDDWSFGQPDLVVKHPQAFPVEKLDKDLYVFFIFDYVFPEDTWINSIQVRPGNPKVVHHANVHLVPPMFKAPQEGYIAGDFDPSARGTIMISGWVPGTNTVKLDEGTAVRIPKGMRLGIQIHYAPTEQESMDQTEIGMYFVNGIVNKNLRMLFGDRKDLVIQPEKPDQVFVARNTFNSDAVIKFFHVHMHLRGKSYVMKLTYPDGRTETALEVQNYDFNWQRSYILNQSMRVPKGTVVEYIGTYDNSAKNRFNPDPAQTVRWGEFTKDEMMQGRIFYEAADEKLNLRVVKGHAVANGDAAKGQ